MVIEGTLTLNDCSFVGDLSDGTNTLMWNGIVRSTDINPSSDEQYANSSLCVWQSSMVTVNGSGGTIISASSSFINSSYGALSVYDGGEFSGEQNVLMNNNPGLELFPSMRYNIICLSSVRVSSLVNITSVGEGSDGEMNNTSLWINAVKNCQLGGIASAYTSSFYIPTLSGMDITRETSGGVITVSGSSFIPCDLSCTVTADERSFGVELTALNESVAIGVLNESVVVFLEAATDVDVMLTGENGQELTEAYPVNVTTKETMAQAGKETGVKTGTSSVFVILFVLALIIVALLALVIVVLVYLYLKGKRQNVSLADNADSDVEMQDQKDMEEKHNPEEITLEDISVVTQPQTPIDSLPSLLQSESSTLADNPPTRLQETFILAKVVPVIRQQADGKEGYVLLSPADLSIPQTAIQQFVVNTNADTDRDRKEIDEEEQPTVEDHQRRKRKKKNKNKKKNDQRLNETAEEEDDEEEEENKQLGNQNSATFAGLEVTPLTDNQTEQSDKEEESESASKSKRKKKKRKRKKKNARMNKSDDESTTEEEKEQSVTNAQIPSASPENTSGEEQTKTEGNNDPPEETAVTPPTIIKQEDMTITNGDDEDDEDIIDNESNPLPSSDIQNLIEDPDEDVNQAATPKRRKKKKNKNKTKKGAKVDKDNLVDEAAAGITAEDEPADLV